MNLTDVSSSFDSKNVREEVKYHTGQRGKVPVQTLSFQMISVTKAKAITVVPDTPQPIRTIGAYVICLVDWCRKKSQRDAPIITTAHKRNVNCVENQLSLMKN